MTPDERQKAQSTLSPVAIAVALGAAACAWWLIEVVKEVAR
jgi:hypothetical protein